MRYETSVRTTADPMQVWTTWMDIEHWSDWTPSIESIERLDRGAFGVGSTARVKQPKMRPMTWKVTESTPGRSFIWAASTAGTNLVAGHFLEPGPNGGATIRLSIDHTGLLAGLLGRFVGDRIGAYLQMEADGAKHRAESLPEPRPGTTG